MAGMGFALIADRTIVRMTLPERLPATLDFQAAGVDELLRGIGRLRAEMPTEPVPAWSPGTAYEALLGLTTAVSPTGDGGAVLHVKDAAFGWRHYAFKTEGARLLGEALLTATGGRRRTERVWRFRRREISQPAPSVDQATDAEGTTSGTGQG